jgi:hypothetical protein
MRNDKKIQRLKHKFGLKGYGLYNHILESIAEKLTSENPLPDLEDTANDIAIEYNEDTILINEMMAFMLTQGLFELCEVSTRILCNKIYKYLDSSQTKSAQIKEMIKKYKNNLAVTESPRPSETFRVRTEENITEENITEENRIDNPNPPINTIDSINSNIKLIYKCEYFEIYENSHNYFISKFNLDNQKLITYYNNLEKYFIKNPEKEENIINKHLTIRDYLINVWIPKSIELGK